MYPYDAHTGPPLTLADRLQSLNDTLRSLATRLKDTIAGAVGGAVAQAVRDFVRSLLGDQGHRREGDGPWRDRFEQGAHGPRRDGFDPDSHGWDEDEDPWDRDGREDERPPVRTAPGGAGDRWRDAVRAAVQAGLWWLRTRPLRRPVLAAALVALAAAGTALAAGPAVAACVSVAASVASLLVTADSARSVADLLGALAG